jgi:hypothetical protein
MPEKVTSLNGLKVTLEYGNYNFGAHNKDYVKFNGNVIINHKVKYHPLAFSEL